MLEREDLYHLLHESVKPEIEEITDRVYINEAISLLNSYGSYAALCRDLDALGLFNLYLGKKAQADQEASLLITTMTVLFRWNLLTTRV